MIKEQTIYLNEFENKLLSIKEQNHLSLENQKAQTIKYESLLRHYTTELEKAKENIVACDVKAPIAGTLLYNTIPKGGKKSKVEIGDSIWYNQSFMQIPDTNNMIVKTLIKEVDLRFLKKGQKVKIILDSYPDKPFYGVVSYIDSIARNKEDSPVKYFETVVTVDNTNQMLRSGMSATVEIVYERVTDEFSLPVDAIRQQKGITYVLVKERHQNVLKQVIHIDKIGKEFATLKNMDELLALGSEVAVR
jgi:HlyD family secretion protein